MPDVKFVVAQYLIEPDDYGYNERNFFLFQSLANLKSLLSGKFNRA